MLRDRNARIYLSCLNNHVPTPYMLEDPDGFLHHDLEVYVVKGSITMQLGDRNGTTEVGSLILLEVGGF